MPPLPGPKADECFSFHRIFFVYLCVFNFSVQDKTYTGRFFSFLRHVQITTLPSSISRRRSKTLLTCLHIRKITNIQLTVSCCFVLSYLLSLVVRPHMEMTLKVAHLFYMPETILQTRYTATTGHTMRQKQYPTF